MKNQLSGVLTGRHRTAIGATVDEIVVQPGSEKAFELMKITETPAGIIEHEVISGYGGKTQERSLGEEGKQVDGVSTTTKIFKPGAYQEFHRFNESDILKLRKAGTIGERGVTGLTDNELSMTAMVGRKLQVRIKNRMQQLIWDAIMNGSFVYKGQTFSFGIPSANNLTAGTDWSDPDAADVFADLSNLIVNTDVTRKYIFKEFMVNPKTAYYIRRSLLKKYGIDNPNVKNASTGELWKFYLPGLPELCEVKDMWQDETVGLDGTVTAGVAQYFVPDDKVLLVPNLEGTMYPWLGEFELTENLNDPSATLDRPAVGIYSFIDEQGLEKRKAPHADVVAGFNGAPNLKRPNDIIKLSV